MDDQASQPRKFHVLASAYACKPGEGADANLAWQWATGLARAGHEVHVLTRTANRAAIEARLALQPQHGLSFAYTDLPAWLSRLNRRLSYHLWQLPAFFAARRLCRNDTFDIIHDLNFGRFHDPSCLAFLGRPFVLGPVGGGEQAPERMRSSFSLYGLVQDKLRALVNWMVRVDPLMTAVYERSAVTLCKTDETRRSIPERFRGKCLVRPEGGADGPDSLPRRSARGNGRFQVLYVGRLLHWKGLHLGLEAFARLRQRHPEAQLTVIGDGPEEARLHVQAEQLGIADAVAWRPWTDRKLVTEAYGLHHALLFPSLHDAGGKVLLEALSRGLPVVCLDAGDPGRLVDSCSGFRVKAAGAEQAVEGMADALARLAKDKELSRRMSEGAWRRARRDFSWATQIERMEELYRDVCGLPGTRTLALR